MIETHSKEIIACLKFELAARAHDATVCKPTTDFVRYDYVLDWNGRLYRVQVKYGGGSTSTSQGNAVVDLRKRSRKSYDESEVDVIIAYLPQVDKILWLGPEIFSGKTSLCIRYKPPLNGYRAGLRADEHVW